MRTALRRLPQLSPRALDAPAYADTLSLLASTILASRACALRFLHGNGVQCVAQLLRLCPPSYLTLHLFAAVARLVSVLCGTVNVLGLGTSDVSGDASTTPATPGVEPTRAVPSLIVYPYRDTPAWAPWLANATPIVSASSGGGSGSNSSNGSSGAAGSGLNADDGPATSPYAVLVSRLAHGMLLFDLQLWAAADPDDHCVMLRALCVYASHNPAHVRSAVSAHALLEVLRSQYYHLDANNTAAYTSEPAGSAAHGMGTWHRVVSH